ncbi:MAG TPA: hypothetical protein VFA31_07040 [Candidatus Polarisedimenticolia bacterium]|jgi:hypothetical protein|nr:hypothetical protein [Candidatus Polarisedimenticolia bacterium]
MREPAPIHGAAPSIWPVTLATGVGIAAVGALTSPIVIAAGVFVTVAALVGWIRQALEEVTP